MYTINTKKILLLHMLALVCTAGFAGTYTATASGSWRNPTTWTGGVAPSFNITTDQIIIPQSITVDIDSAVSLDGGNASLEVEGTLTTAVGDSLALSYGTISGLGTITLGSVSVDSNTVYSFGGRLVVNSFYTSAIALQFTTHATVNQTLVLSRGVMSLVSGGLLTLGTNATVVIAGGTLSGLTTSISSTSYNLVYTQNSLTTGVELSSSVNNLTIAVSDSSTITLSADLIVTGTLAMTSGMLGLNTHNLTVTGDIAGAGTGSIYSTNVASIFVNTPSSPSGALRFSTTGNSLRNLTLSLTGTNSTLMVGSDLNIYGTLRFNSGYLDVTGHGLILATGANIAGAGSSSYIITGDSGYVSQQVTAGVTLATTYPVGTSTRYAPATITLATGSASGVVSVGTAAGVYAQGTSGTDISSSQSVVDATWYLHSDITSNLNLNLGVSWSGAMEVNAFDRDSAYISHYTAGAWDSDSISAATTANAMYSIHRSGITSLSPFAVFDKNTKVDTSATGPNGIKTTTTDMDIVLYPNPTQQNIYITRTTTDKINVDIINMDGQVVGRYILANSANMIPVQDLAQGNYAVKLYNSQMNITKKFSKI